MSIALGSDHRGFELKNRIINFLKSSGYEYVDFGCNSADAVDYPDFASDVARCIIKGQADYGILICASGIGMSITANKYNGIRAAICCNPELAVRSRRHNDANVLCLGSDFVDEPTAIDITRNFLTTAFEGGRHQRRLDKISKIESVLLDNK